MKIFSIEEGENFLYEAYTNKIFRLECADNSEVQKLVAGFVRRGEISAQILDSPKFSISFAEYQQILKKKMSTLILEITRRCNMRCNYCVYSGKFPGRRAHENFDMPRETLERAIKFYAKHSEGLKEGDITFYGGEALLRDDEIFYAIEYAQKIMPQKKMSFAISTNGLLLNEKIFSRLEKMPNVALNVTLNGPAQDKYRRTIDGKATLKILLDNLISVQKFFPTVWENQIGFLCNYANFEELDAQQKFYLNVVDKMPLLINQIVPPNFIELLSKSDEFFSVLEKFANDYLRTGDAFLAAYFRVPIAVIHDRPIFSSPRSFINTCLPFVNRIFVTAEGNFQICTETPELDGLGNLDNGFNFTVLKKIYETAENFFCDSNCRRCWAQRLCPVCFKDFLKEDGNFKTIEAALCDRIRSVTLSNLKLYCRLSYYRRDLLEKLI